MIFCNEIGFYNDVSKGQMLHYLQTLLQIERNDTYCVSDDVNDELRIYINDKV